MSRTDQMRSGHALAFIEGITDKKRRGAFRQGIRELPASVRINGLAQAIAMFQMRAAPRKDESREKEDAKQAREGLLDCVRVLGNWLAAKAPDGPELITGELLPAMLRCNRVEYYAIQAEVFAYLDWVKTLAVGLIEAPDDDAEREDSSGGER